MTPKFPHNTWLDHLELALKFPRPYTIRTLKAPSDPEFALKALYAYREGLTCGKK